MNPTNCRHHGWTPGQETLPHLRHDMDKNQLKDKDPNFRSHRLPVVFLPCRCKGPGMEHTTGEKGDQRRALFIFSGYTIRNFSFVLLMGASTPYLWTTMGRYSELPPLCNPMDCSLPCSSIRGILQARVLEWVDIAFSVLTPRN